MILNDQQAVMYWGAVALVPAGLQMYPLGVLLRMMDGATERLRRVEQAGY